MSAYFRLQELTQLHTDTGDTFTQRIEEAVDISSFKSLVVQVRKPIVGKAGCTLSLQHASELVESAFVDVPTTFSLDTDPNEVITFQDLLRYVRWKAVLSATSTTAFLIDVVCREA